MAKEIRKLTLAKVQSQPSFVYDFCRIGHLTHERQASAADKVVLSQMPAYAKFLKEILSKKRKVEEKSVVKLTERCSAILQNKLPQKCGDPRSFTIPCFLGSTKFEISLCDSDVSINYMPFSIFKKLDGKIGGIRSIFVSLQLADHTTIIPKGIMEVVLVRVDKFVFLMDFIVVKMEENREVPLILGRPLLATGRAILDIQERYLILRVREKILIFKMEGEGEGG
nr:uncharacterized protein LOC104100402 [Nicotiana tomentosiformis]